jgi:RHS repeat-associated protein
MTYDSYGNVIAVTGAESNSVNLSYSSTYSGAYLTEISATVGQDTITARATYDCYRGWVTSIQDPKGGALDSGYDYLFSYDALGRVTKKEFPLLTGQSQRSYLEAVYDDTNRTTSIIDQLRHYSVREYDKLGRSIDIRWYTGVYGSGTLYATESYTYRYDNCLLTTTDPAGHVYSRTYDFLGRAIQVLYPDSSTTSFSYDDTSNKVTETNGRGYDRIYWFDWLGQLTKVEQEYATNSLAVTAYQHDELGHLTSFTDAENHTTSYTFASFFGVTRITYPDSTYEQYEYDSVGRIAAFTDCEGNEILYTYDSINRMIQVQYPDLSTVSFTYDLNSNRTEMEDSAPDSGDFVEYEFDEWNRLISETRHISQSVYTTSYQYDVGSRLTGLTYPDSMQVLYSYDDLNRVTEVKRYVDGSNDEILMNNAQYNTEGQVTQFDYGNGLQAHFSYDSRDRITAIDVKDNAIPFLDLSYSYDSTGNIVQIMNGWRDCSSAWHTDTESYGYDGLDRITSATCTSWSHAFSYDKAGNRTEKDGTTYYINDVNEVTSLSDGTTFTYDENGNRIQKTQGNDTWTYTYDCCNRLTEVEENSVTLGEYKYDGNGKRIQATEDDTTTTYFYSGYSVLLEETPTGTVTYIYGPVGKLAKRATMGGESHTYFYHTDKLGSCRLVTDEDKNIISATTFHPFGGIDVREGSEHPLYTDKEMDSTGLYYYGARYYDPEIGRFLTRDTSTGRIAAPQSLNRYSYVLNNPAKFIDSNGCGENIPYMEADNSSPRRGTLKGLLEGILTVGAPGLLILVSLIFPPVALVLAAVSVVFAASGLAILLEEDGTTWQEDLDGDGDWETVVEYKDKTGQLTRLEIETDGTIIKKLYRINGDLINTWMLIPDSENPEGYIIYVWDEKSQEWLLDQDQDGIPDSTEEAESSGESGNSSNNSGSSNSNDQSAPTEPNQPY